MELGIQIPILNSSFATRFTELAGMIFGFISYLITFLGVIRFSGKHAKLVVEGKGYFNVSKNQTVWSSIIPN